MKEFMTVPELQVKLGLSRLGAYRLVNMPDFPKIRAGRKILIPITGFNEWVQKGGTTK